MKELLLVFAGGGSGSICRYLLGKLYPAGSSLFPLATLSANFLSCVVLGIVLALGLERTSVSPAFKLLLITGFCGGFSTYSSFTAETLELFKQSHTGLTLANILANFALSVAGLYLGSWLLRLL